MITAADNEDEGPVLDKIKLELKTNARHEISDSHECAVELPEEHCGTQELDAISDGNEMLIR